MPNKSKLFGLLTRKERWHLSWKGWLLVFLAMIGLGFGYVLGIYPFLAISDRQPTDVLVMEGWMRDFAVRIAVNEFKTGNYRAVYSTGGPVIGSAGYVNEFNTYASVGGDMLVGFGIPKEQVHAVPAHQSGRDRTYTSAVALRRWFEEHGLKPSAINLITEDAHARRSVLLFQMALGPQIKVGVLPIRNPDYDPDRWWRYSEGVREMLGETIAYVYAKFFFRPE